MALAVRQTLEQNGLSVKAFNVATVGTHARRSWLTYQKVFGDTAQAGIIPLADKSYDPAHWWRSSEGLDQVFSETIAYAYAQFFFLWN